MPEPGAVELVVPRRAETATTHTVRVTRTDSHPPPASHRIPCPHRQVRPFFVLPELSRHRTGVKVFRRSD